MSGRRIRRKVKAGDTPALLIVIAAVLPSSSAVIGNGNAHVARAGDSINWSKGIVGALKPPLLYPSKIE